MQAAIGRRQLEKLPSWLESRRAHAQILSDCFARIPALRGPLPPEQIGHAWYKFYAFIRPELLAPGWDKERIMTAINAEGVPCMSGSCSEIYLEKAFAEMASRPPERLPVARELGETSLMFLVHPTLRESDLIDTCRAVNKVFAAAAC